MKRNAFAEIAKLFGIILILLVAIIFIFAQQYSWMIVPLIATLAIMAVSFGFFAALNVINKKKK